MKKIKKKQNEEKRDNPSIVAQCICGLDENPELVVEIGRYQDNLPNNFGVKFFHENSSFFNSE